MYANARSNITSIDFNVGAVLLTGEASLIYKLVTLNKNLNLVPALILAHWVGVMVPTELIFT